MKQYTCVECAKIYSEADMPKDSVCKDSQCPGGGLTGLVIEIAGGGPQQQGTTYIVPEGNMPLREAGLCMLLMDASGSMAEPAYKDYSFPSKYAGQTLPNGSKIPNDAKLSKREAISDAAALAIFDLKQMLKKDDAFICAILFDTRQSVAFTKTVSEILSEYGSPAALAQFLHHKLAEMNGGTDINSVLTMAYSFVGNFLKGDMPGMGNYTPVTHTQYSTQHSRSIDVPNVRALVYTDGEQLPQFGEIRNPFKNDVPDLLMGAYIGQTGDPGCNALKNVIGNCPVHNSQQFFVLDSPQNSTTLRGLFRMASGTSGFCPACIASY